MKRQHLICDLQDGTCVNCGGTTDGRRCTASVSLAELFGMYYGTLPQRAHRVTRVQLWTLQATYKQEGDPTDEHESDPTKNAGPGTELQKLIDRLGLSERPGCRCRKRAGRMNKWAPDGCEANFTAIVGWMREAYDLTTWSETTTAAARALTTGLAFEINWLDPVPSLVRLAIEKARTS